MSSSDDVPFYLMPVAAVLGILAAFSTLRLLYLLYASMTTKSVSPYTPKTPKSAYIILLVTIIGSILGYAKVVASVNNAMEASSHALFDPYELLNIATSANATEIKQAYRNLSKIHHPDKGGSPAKFQSINLAYQALADETGMLNYKQYGHPEGPPSSSSLDFALPSWLLHPEGNVVFVFLFLYLGMFVLIIYTVVKCLRGKPSSSSATGLDEVAKHDTLYLAANLKPDTSHLDVLYMIATTPENVAISKKALEKIEKLKQERRAKEKEQEKKARQKQTTSDDDFDMLMNDASGWANDDDDEETKQAALKEQQLQEEKKKERLSLKKAQGTDTVKLEGVDEGVIGQAWVESTLIRQGKWPPTQLGFLEGQKFDYNGNQVGAMEHPAIRRNLCMVYGRLNSNILNSETQLLEAGSKGLIDPTYFQATAEFRRRAVALLDAALKTAVVLRSNRLTKTIIEAITMFKIGTPTPLDPSTIAWFEGVMNRQYKCKPKLELNEWKIYTEDEDEIAANDTCTLEMNMTRTHAEQITKQKVEMCKKQGIPPQVALQTYREIWWILIAAEKLDGDESARIKYQPVNEQMKQMLDSVDVETFASEKQENRIVRAFPALVQNCAQPEMKLKVQFKAPSIPGKYRFHVAIKSLDFLGADQEVTCELALVDEASVKPSTEEEDDEGKKEK